MLVRLGIESSSVSNSPTDQQARLEPKGEQMRVAGLQQNISPKVNKF
jgi:hypothetical protein